MHHGSVPLTPEEVLERIRGHVYVRDECRIWAGPVDGRGHPRVGWRRERHSARLLMLKLSGRLPRKDRGLVAWTTCADPLCMAERHIVVGTRADMARWMAKHRLSSHGLPHSLAIARSHATRGTARMPMSCRHEVARMRAEGSSWAAIGERYGITKTAARNSYLRWERLGLIHWMGGRAA